MICENCLYNKNCQFLLKHRNGEVVLCSAFEDKSEWVHLPCKVGDVVYQVTRNFISEFRVRFVEIATCGNLFLHTDLISGIIYTGDVFSESDIGKTVFLVFDSFFLLILNKFISCDIVAFNKDTNFISFLLIQEILVLVIHRL